MNRRENDYQIKAYWKETIRNIVGFIVFVECLYCSGMVIKWSFLLIVTNWFGNSLYYLYDFDKAITSREFILAIGLLIVFIYKSREFYISKYKRKGLRISSYIISFIISMIMIAIFVFWIIITFSLYVHGEYYINLSNTPFLLTIGSITIINMLLIGIKTSNWFSFEETRNLFKKH